MCVCGQSESQKSPFFPLNVLMSQDLQTVQYHFQFEVINSASVGGKGRVKQKPIPWQ